MNKVEVKNLYKIFGRQNHRALKMLKDGCSKDRILKETGCSVGVNNANISVKSGEIFVIMGLSGSGKSTLLRCLNRLINPTSGEVFVDGKNITAMNKQQLRQVRRDEFAMVFQHFGLLPHRNVIQNVGFGLELQGVSKAERLEKSAQAIESVGLKGYEQSATQHLSGGMQQRVGLARALASAPEVLLMDEAFSALDPLIRANMQDDLLELQSQMHKTIIFITHDLDEALKLGDRIAIMKDGLIEQIDTPEQILISPASDYVASFVENVDRSKVITAKTVMRMPSVVATHKDGPAQAVRYMKQTGLSTLYVVDKNREVKGYIRIDDAIRLNSEQKNSLDEIIQTDLPTTSPDTSLLDLMQTASETTVPICVTNEKNHILGVVTRASMLAAMAGEGYNNG